MGPAGRYIRSSLRRRLFWWFVATIFVTVSAIGCTMGLMSHASGTGWWREYERLQSYVSRELGTSWHDPATRDGKLASAAEVFDVDAELRDVNGNLVSRVGDPCEHPGFKAPVLRDGVRVGDVRACFNHRRHAPYGPLRTVLVLLIAAIVLSAATGKIARRIARPLDELTETVKRIGAGDYSARTKLGCNEPGEIGVVSEAVNDMAAKIEQQLKDQRELLAAVSHELRTPLARVRIISELGRDNGPTQKTWDDIDREVLEMDALVGELLASSRVQFEALNLRDVDVRDAAERAIERAGLPPEKLKLETSAKTIKVDATLLARALANLLENAKKHAGGADQLEVRDEPGKIVFEVHDRGPGLNGDAGRVFEPFQGGTDTRGNGLGLGLALVQRIALAHRGEAFAHNRDGGGAVVGVRLPTLAGA
ncbi:MAG: HAMP domain-containing histidine kinase [Myxococcaceae bacterium]|nr:HAMP domain-containing histidine kinase [Myxococcaceae bacterium]